MTLSMTTAEIKMRFRDLNPKQDRIGLLADLNGCRRSQILEVLELATPVERYGSSWVDPDKDDPTMHELYQQGGSDVKIAEQYGCISRYQVSKWRQLNGLEPNMKPIGGHDVKRVMDLEKAKTMYDQGMLDHQIAAECGVSAVTICQWRKRYDLPAHGRKTKKADQPEPKRVTVKAKRVMVDDLIKNAPVVDIVAVHRKAATIDKAFDDEINDMIASMPPADPQPIASGEPAEFDEMPDPYDLLIEDLCGDHPQHEFDPCKIISLNRDDLKDIMDDLIRNSVRVAEDELIARVSSLQQKLIFLRGVAIGAGIRNIDELLEVLDDD